MTLSYIYSRLLKKLRGTAITNSTLHKTSKIESGSQIVNSHFGKYSYCCYDCQIINCEIGAFCSIANYVVIGCAAHPMDWVSMSPVFYEGRDSIKKKFSNYKRKEDKKTYIGNDVWIGEKVLIKQGVKIGNGAVIGMGSVVTKDVDPYCIVAGNPAKVIRKRFSDDIIEKLQYIKWWDFDDKTLTEYAKYITDPEKFISEVLKK